MAQPNLNPYNTLFVAPYHSPVVGPDGKMSAEWQRLFSTQLIPALKGLGATGSSGGGATGATGAAGAAGSQGATGATGASSGFSTFAADTTSTTYSSSPGGIRWNHLTQIASTYLYLSNTDQDGTNLALLQAPLQPGTMIYIQDS
jgi:hypothetical protein